MFSRNPYLYGAFALLLGAGTIAAMSPPAATQSAASQDAQTGPLIDVPAAASGNNPAAQAETDRTRQYVLTMKMVLGACFKGVEDVAPETRVPVGFALDRQGQLDGLPDYLGPAAASAADRQLYLAGVTALDRCAPFPAAGEPARFEVVFSGDGVAALQQLDEPGAPAGTSVSRAAAAVNAAADKATESGLSLTRAKRTEIQRRLRVLGFDPQGADGVFGDKTRTALSEWQTDKGFAATGYLNAVQLLALNAQSQAGYEEDLAKDPPKKQKRRVQVCQRIGILGLKRCHYEYR